VHPDTNTEFPFCSKRCRLLDLNNWASERYVISEPAADEAEQKNTREQNNNEDS
jgi:endogenous inhibitor of DNA gyrase (YacG/DUF329 family)